MKIKWMSEGSVMVCVGLNSTQDSGCRGGKQKCEKKSFGVIPPLPRINLVGAHHIIARY